MSNKVFVHKDFDVFITLKPPRRCCHKELIKLGFNNQWVCEDCKSLYELHMVKLSEKNLSKENKEYREEFFKQKIETTH